MPLNVLLLEDSPADAELLQIALARGGINAEFQRVASQDDFTRALNSFSPDIILADFNLPGFSGLAGLNIRNELLPDIPFVFVSGSLGDEMAVTTLRQGATDFVLKDRMARLPSAVTRALEEAKQKRERDRISAQLNAERQFMRATLNTAQALIAVVNSSGAIMYLNPIAERIVGQSFAAVRGKPFWEIFAAQESLEAARLHIRSALEWSSPLPKRSWPMTSHTGRTIVWSSGVLSGDDANDRLVLSGIDITEQERAEEHAFYLGHFDAATGLPNRKHFLQQLGNYCQARDKNVETVLVVMMLGVARVTEIGDSYGDAVINQVLVELVQRMRVWQVHQELLARVADNSFALAFEVGRGTDIDVLAPHILDQLRAPVQAAERQWALPVHGGVALYPDDATEPYMLLQCAEAALHCAEAEARQSFAFYTPLLSDQARERLQIESELREALRKDDQLVMHYQPQIDISSGRVIGLEALIRWRHPRLTWLPPNHFIPIAEMCGLMPELGNWVLRSVCQQIGDWQQAGTTAPTVAVNLSASQFSAASLISDIGTTLQAFHLSPELIELELTESASMHDPQASIAIMSQLRKMGLKISIDDFGTGYSNLAYLKRFPVDRLKLDQAFVRDIATDANDLAISRTIIAIAQQLNLEVVAEGVETTAQMQLLANAGCNTMQGYLYSPAVPADKCVALMQQTFPIQ